GHDVVGRVDLAALPGGGVDDVQVWDRSGARPDLAVDDAEREDVGGVGGLGAVVLEVAGRRVVGDDLGVGVGAEVQAPVRADAAVVQHPLPGHTRGDVGELAGLRVEGEQACVHRVPRGEVDHPVV